MYAPTATCEVANAMRAVLVENNNECVGGSYVCAGNKHYNGSGRGGSTSSSFLVAAIPVVVVVVIVIVVTVPSVVPSDRLKIK